MKDLNKLSSESESLRKRTLKDIDGLLSIYSDYNSSIESSFREEMIRNKGSMNGMEDFYMLRNAVRKNFMAVKGAHSMLHRMSAVSGYDVKEDSQIDEELKDILG